MILSCPFDDSIRSDSSTDDRIDTAEIECGGEIACDGLCVEEIINDEEEEDMSSYLQDCDAVIEDLQAQLKSIEETGAGTELITSSSAINDWNNMMKIGDHLIILG